MKMSKRTDNLLDRWQEEFEEYQQIHKPTNEYVLIHLKCCDHHMGGELEIDSGVYNMTCLVFRNSPAAFKRWTCIFAMACEFKQAMDES